MDEAGFTLTDMLAALLILGLALTGLGQGLFALSRLQHVAASTAAEARDARMAAAALTRLLDGAGPFRAASDSFAGQADGFAFACGEGARCAVRLERDGDRSLLRLQDAEARVSRVPAGPADIRFRYIDEARIADRWPRGEDGRLIAVELQSASGAVLARHRLWRDQPLSCAFDSVLRDCYSEPTP